MIANIFVVSTLCKFSRNFIPGRGRFSFPRKELCLDALVVVVVVFFFFFQARVVLYKNGNEVVSLKFKASATNDMEWFSLANLISSPWNDLKSASLQYFSIIEGFSRRVF